jgi:hypothetical protein
MNDENSLRTIYSYILSLKIVTVDIVDGDRCEIDGIFESGFL